MSKDRDLDKEQAHAYEEAIKFMSKEVGTSESMIGLAIVQTVVVLQNFLVSKLLETDFIEYVKENFPEAKSILIVTGLTVKKMNDLLEEKEMKEKDEP